VSHDTQANGSSRQGRRPTPRPDLGRPSLFADFDQESAEDVEPQRIRLLSTLESQRGTRGRPRARRLPTGRAHPWLTRALMVAMGLGMLVMLLSFIQLLRRPPPTLQVPQAMAATAPHLPTSATAPAVTAVPEAPTEAAEIIDMAPPAGGTPPSPLPAQPASPTFPVTAQASGLGAPSGSQQAATATTSRSTQAAAKAGTQRPGAKRDAGASHDDVALVEAMLAHAGPRKAPPSPNAALEQCGTGSSPETAVCRARICVQHPSLPACHAP